ncbi:hypothetical protein K7G98_24690, partial [Saccharothrix sp. MB29]|nr:hypothetical protein [Saccharothrix sp. MB29]
LVERVRAHGSTLGIVVQAAWGLVLAGLTGRQDVVFGVTVSTRPAELPESDRMVGLMINTVPARVRFDSEERVGDLLGRLRDEQAELLAHQHVALPDIRAAAGAGGMFDTAVVVENYPLDPGRFARDGLSVTAVHGEDAAHFAVGVMVSQVAARTIDHQPDLVDVDRATAIGTVPGAPHPGRPGATAASLPVLTRRERGSSSAVEHHRHGCRPDVPRPVRAAPPSTPSGRRSRGVS